MELTIWHDDLNATREKPVKPRNVRRSTAKFASINPMTIDDVVIKKEDKRQYMIDFSESYNAAVNLERKLSSMDCPSDNDIQSVINAYTDAKSKSYTYDQKTFCQQRIDLCQNKMSIWR